MKIVCGSIILQIFVFFNLQAQSPLDQIRVYSKEIKIFTDSITYFENQLEQQKINAIEYQVAMGRLSDQINYFSAYIYNEALPILDSIYIANKEKSFVDSIYIIETIDENNPVVPEENGTLEDPGIEIPPVDKQKFNPVMTATKILMGTDSKRTSWNLVIGIGSSIIQSENENTGIKPNINLWQSFRIPQDIGLTFRTRIGPSFSKFGLSYGVLFNYLSLSQSSNFTKLEIQANSNQPRFVDANNEGLDKLKIKVTYLKVPLGIDVRINKVWLSVNSYLKLLLFSKQVFNFNESSANKSQLIYKNHIGINQYTFGVEYLLGYKKYGIVLQQDFTNLLSKDAQDSFNVWQFGLRLRI
ncbi:MAG: hypothetical protein KA251_04605 [Saprospiraceae bacterium]|mgnify:CR=1 FL=1|nr:hypothetical protein [Candidatus Vicinibacter affinis]MBP6172295.1 hypothetical protein [Saprospiraceae bacterium]MBK6572008.1 hypothetical protein [Candidatus Vicinibacter affinis]MBK7305206.1 hypothetical protein [Candidatus Vicinibacter affinis]MBK7693744.1 hypothetical protein [Candidatus Vicinibacter affinis]